MIHQTRKMTWVPVAAAVLVLAFGGQRSGANGVCTPAVIMSPQGDGEGTSPSLSADGRYMAIRSRATNFVPGDTSNPDIFVFDRVTCGIDLVSVSLPGTQPTHFASNPTISDDGRFVAFEASGSNLAPDANAFTDVFVRDRVLGSTVLASIGDDGLQGNSSANDSSLSGNGQFVAFVSEAALVQADTNGEADVFVRDLVSGTTERVSISTTGDQGGPTSFTPVAHPVLSFDGRYVAFASTIPNLVSGDTNNTADIFLRDRLNGTTTRISVSSAEQQSTASASSPAISGDGRFIAFHLGPGSGLVSDETVCDGVFVRDVALGETSCLALRPSGGPLSSGATEPEISDDGRFVSFLTGTPYVPGDVTGTDVYVYDRVTNIRRRISVNRFGNRQQSSFTGGPTLSGDGAYAAFHTDDPTIIIGDPNNTTDAFVAEWQSLPDAPYAQVIRNGTFASSMQNWETFATPDSSYIVAQVSGGVLEFYRQPPPAGTTNQAVVFQNTTSRFLANAPIEARIDLGNSSSVRKRMSVLLHDSDFSDLAVCTFWLPPNTALTTYVIRTHTTKPWNNATIGFYAATPGSDGGFYRVDNVRLVSIPEQDDDRTDCVDPLAPIAPGGAAGPNLLINGTFDTGLAPWTTFGQIVWQIASGMFEFYRPAGTPAGVVLQQTGVPTAASDIITANFYLGNSSGVRKRVTVLLHDANFSDLSACSFWLPPGLPLAPYRMRTYATQAWTDATLSIYPATVGTDQWIQLDNVSLQLTPAATTDGTNCLEPGADIQTALRRSTRPLTRPAIGAAPPVVGARPTPAQRASSSELTAISRGEETLVVWQDSIDLRSAQSARLVLESSHRATRSRAEVQVSLDGLAWQSLSLLPDSNDWLRLGVSLDAYAGSVVHVRIVLEARVSGEALIIRDVRVVSGN